MENEDRMADDVFECRVGVAGDGRAHLTLPVSLQSRAWGCLQREREAEVGAETWRGKKPEK